MSRFIDLSGRVIGYWTVLTRDPVKGDARWLCRCKCGRLISVLAGSLLGDKSGGCSSCTRKHPYAHKPKRDLTGAVFSRLSVIRPEKLEYKIGISRRRWVWRCVCVCGNETVVSGTDLLIGRVQSCGCLKLGQKGPMNPRWRGCGEISRNYWNQVERNARLRGLVLDVSIQYAWDLFLLQNRVCALSGLSIRFSGKLGEATASFDRIDSKSGYLYGNVQWVHKDVNQMKMDFDESYFKSLCRLVVVHEDGKLIKPPGHQPPDIAGKLDEIMRPV